ncbi:MAG: hypothetical protein LIO62_05540, partial [Clostridiales bacterium]|nr:hypothetical protein [Clostridiales bacterium]
KRNIDKFCTLYYDFLKLKYGAVSMITVFTNADFISFDENDLTYSVMVVNGKDIAYMGYNIPICYDDAKVVDLGGRAVIPLVNDKLCLTYHHADCKVLAAGERADFAVIDKNILKDPNGIKVIDVYVHGKKK